MAVVKTPMAHGSSCGGQWTLHGDEGLQVSGADWNASVGEVQRWVEEDGPGWEVVFTSEATCFTGAGGTISSRNNFFVVNRTGKRLLIENQGHVEQGASKGHAVVKNTPLRTHHVDAIAFRVEGQLWLENGPVKKLYLQVEYVAYSLIAGDSGRAKMGFLNADIGRARDNGMMAHEIDAG